MFFYECFIQNCYISFEFWALNTPLFLKLSQYFIIQESDHISEYMLVMLHVISKYSLNMSNVILICNPTKIFFARLQLRLHFAYLQAHILKFDQFLHHKGDDSQVDKVFKDLNLASSP